jgi:hypothetical protein
MVPLPAEFIKYSTGYSVMHSMRKLWRISVTHAVTLAFLASAPLFAQTTRSLPNDPAATLGSESARTLSTGQDQPEPSNQSQVPQTGIILGTVTDMNDAPVPAAIVALQEPDGSDVRSVTTNESGFFEIRDVEAGRPYGVSIRAAGFSEWDSPVVTLEPGQSKILDVSQLRIEQVQTAITVTPESSEQIATEQVKAAEKQRGFGIIPNFYAVYTSNPEPLTAKLRFNLAVRLARDPVSLAGVALLAGVGQAAGYPNYVQGARGYGERFAENYANSYTDLMLDAVILPTVLHQDPRYFLVVTKQGRQRALAAELLQLRRRSGVGRHC